MPAATPVTVLPLTLQTLVVDEVNITASLDVAVAETLPVPFTAIAGAAPKLIVWLVLACAKTNGFKIKRHREI